MTSDDDLNRLHGCLGRERVLLEALAHRLWKCDRALDRGGRSTLDQAVLDLEEISRAVRAEELVRALQSCALGLAYGLGPEPTLEQLARVLPAPWSSLVATHGLTLRAEIADVRALQDVVVADSPSRFRRLAEAVLPPSLPRFVGYGQAA
ncbi:MAG: hypothetical protein ACKO91_08185 [Acidimicrobiales bacterium]